MLSTWLAVILTLAADAFPYDSYPPATLLSVVERTRTDHPELPRADVNVHPVEKYRARVEYMGVHRPIPADRREILDRWLAVNAGKEFVGIFQDEYLVREGESEFWIPIQKMLVRDFDMEVKKGQQVDLYVAWFLAMKNDLVFVANGFKATCPTGGPTQSSGPASPDGPSTPGRD